MNRDFSAAFNDALDAVATDELILPANTTIGQNDGKHPLTTENVWGAVKKLLAKDSKLYLGAYVMVNYQTARTGRIIGYKIFQGCHQPPYAIYEIRALDGTIFCEHSEYLWAAKCPPPVLVSV